MDHIYLKKKIFNGILWSSIQLIINKIFALAIKLILAKILFPEQFGIVGMAAVFISFVQVFNDLGIGSALVQKKDVNLNESHFYTAFWTGLLWSVLIYTIIIFVVAPLASVFFNEPLLKSIIPVLSLGVLSSPINLIHKVQLTKQMDFKKLAFIDNTSTIFSGFLALLLAYSGAGVWALVFNSVASFIIAMPLYFAATKWKPKFIWELHAFNEIFGFGLLTTATHFINFLMLNVDYLLIGKLLSAAALGKYTLAFTLTDTFRNQLTMMINKVMFPVYSQKQSDPVLLRNYYLKVVKFNTLCVYPIMIFFIVLGTPFILNFFGTKWSGTILPLKILSFSVMIHMLVSSHAILIRGIGKPGIEMKMQVIKALFYIPIISIGVYWYGIVGAACGYVINKMLEVIIAQYYLKRLINVRILNLLFTLKPVLVASAITISITFILSSYNFHYYFCTAALAICYLSLIWLMMGGELATQLSKLRYMRSIGKRNATV